MSSCATPTSHPDLADCRHPGGAQRPDRRALQNHCQRNGGHSEGRIRPHPGAGERRYKTIAKETAGILKGEYGHTPVPVNAALQARVLEGGAPVTCRPADLLKPELAELEADVRRQAQEKGIQLAENAIDDVLTVALFPQIGLKFLENRNNPAAFEPLPQAEAVQPVAKAEKPAASGIYTVEVEGKAFVVKVSDGGDISQLTAATPSC